MKSYSFTKAKQALDNKKLSDSLAHFKDLEKDSEKALFLKEVFKKLKKAEAKVKVMEDLLRW
jgi:hypothetical protein